MSPRFACISLTTLFALAPLACGPSANVTVPSKPLPSAFEQSGGGQSIGLLSWRSYFADQDLQRLIGDALRTSPDLQIALQRIQIARAEVRRKTGVMLPEVSAVAGVGLEKFGRYTADGAGNADTEITPGRTVPNPLPDFGVGLQASWEIDAWGKLKNQRESAVAQYLASVEGKHLVLSSLVADIASAYYELLALDHTRDVLSETLVRQREALEVVRLQKMAGRANELAVQQFEVQLKSTLALDADVKLRSSELENRINLLRGTYPQPIQRSKASLLREVSSQLSAGVPSELLRNRPDIREAELLVEAAKCDLRAARAAFFPSVNITAGVGFQAFNPKFLFSTPESLVYSATVGLVAPLVNRSAIEAEFETAKAEQIQAMYHYQKVILAAYAEVASSLTALAETAKITALKQEQRAAMHQIVETADTLYRAGQATYVEVLMARQGALAAELEWIEALKQQHLVTVALYKALGGGWRG